MKVNFDPEIFSFGVLHVRWYGLMYVIGFTIGGLILRKLANEGLLKFKKEQIDSMLTHILIGMFVGARSIYVLVYNFSHYANDLKRIFYVWEGGLSFHGAILGFAVGSYIFAKKNGVHPFHVFDLAAIAGTQGVFFGRVGNFINMELYGRVTDVPWGIIFPGGGPYPRHPSQLYEAFFEGCVVFAILWIIRKKVIDCGYIYSLFLILFGFVRYFIEFFREADSQLGYYLGGTTTMGQILCITMILVGFLAMRYSMKKKPQIIQTRT